MLCSGIATNPDAWTAAIMEPLQLTADCSSNFAFLYGYDMKQAHTTRMTKATYVQYKYSYRKLISRACGATFYLIDECNPVPVAVCELERLVHSSLQTRPASLLFYLHQRQFSMDPGET